MRPVVALVLVAALALGWWAVSGNGASSSHGTATVDALRAVARRATGTPAGSAQAAEADQAFAAALAFLRDYELPDGRVTRRDQGGDTVSEGEAYAMLVSVAAGDRPRFDAAWRWTRAHLLEPSGHLAWHWQHGSVTGAAPAADADVDAAFALELAARRFGERSDQAAAAMIASAVLHDETASTPEGPVLVAGPWAVGPPPYVDPSYASPSELAALGSAGPGTGTGSLATVASASRALTGRVLGTFALPPDWVQVASDGRPSAVSPPGADTSGDVYGFDAVRLPIRWGASCTAADRQAVAGLWPVLGRAARRGAPTVDLRVTDSSGGGGVASAVGVVAAAAAGWAAGHHATALQLLDKAEAKERANPTYYSSAWVALGRLNLETRRLGTCGGT